MVWARAGLSISAISSALFAAHIHAGSPAPVPLIVAGMLVYPTIVVITEENTSIQDSLYVATISISVGFLFAYSNPYPVGFQDTFRHLQIVRWDLAHGWELSRAFAALYLMTDTIALLLGIPAAAAARIIPGMFYAVTIVLFHAFVARRFLDSSRGQLAATVLFAFNWGVFRFMLEYRTLDIGLLVGILLLGLLFRHDRSDWRISLLILTAVIALAISHLATFIFILFIAFWFGVSRFGQPRSSQFLYVFAVGIVSVVAYLTLVGVIDFTLRGLMFIAEDAFTPAGSGAETPVESSAERPYGGRVFVLDWLQRGLIGIAAIAMTGKALATRDRDEVFLVLSGGAIGGILAVTFVTGFALLPPRILTFFAIPAGLLVGAALETTVDLDRKRIRQISVVVVVFLVLLVPTLSVVKLPSYLVGETQPIRGHAPTDEVDRLKISTADLSQHSFVGTYVREDVSYGGDGHIRYYYSSENDSRYRITQGGNASCDELQTVGNSALIRC